MKLRPGRTQSRPVRPEPALPADLSRAALTRPQQTPPPVQRRRGRRVALVGGLVALLVAALAAAAWATWPSLDADGVPAVTNAAAPRVTLRVERPLGLGAGDVDVRVGAQRVAESDVQVAARGRVTVRLPRLDDGRHEVRIAVHGVGPLRRTLTTTRTMLVDTVAPRARVVEPKPAVASTGYVAKGVAVVTERPAPIQLDVEAGARIELASSTPGTPSIRVDADELPADGVIDMALPEGAQVLTMTTRDAAGNERVVRRRVLVDTRGPKLAAPLPRIVKDATLGSAVRLDDPHGVELRVLVDGTEVEDGIERTVVTAAPTGAGDDGGDMNRGDDAAAAAAPGSAEGEDGEDAEDSLPLAASYRIVLDEPLFEGRHTLELIATDSVGATTRLKRMFVVDSVETLDGASGLRGGARGGDVLQLQQALIERDAANRAKLAAEVRTRTYGPQTAAVVRAYQTNRGMDADGVAGSDTIAALTLKVVVDRGTKQLTLYRSGKAVKTYGVAVGSPKYPTPAGSFAIQNMQKDPTWTPPDSDWAKDAKPIGPGPDNPLGTRWMAIDGTVGIHGTNNPASIGFSVSHGCIRMRIPDVEELFEIVRVGTPVTVV